MEKREFVLEEGGVMKSTGRLRSKAKSKKRGAYSDALALAGYGVCGLRSNLGARVKVKVAKDPVDFA